MSENEYKEKDLEPEGTGKVDFSDLGELFAPVSLEKPVEDPVSPDGESAVPPEIANMPEEDTESASQNLPEDFSESQVPSVDFSDLGPLFSPGQEEQVQPGQAAQILQRLREMAPETSPAPEEPAEEPEPHLNSSFPASGKEELPDFSSEQEPFQPEPGPSESSPENQEEKTSPEVPEEETNDAEDSPETSEENDPTETSSEENSSEESMEPEEKPQEEVPPEEKPEAPSSDPETPAPSGRRSAQKGRPKRKKGEGFFGIPNFLVTLVWIAITVLIGVTLGRMAWLCASDVLAFGREDKPVTITVYEADTIEDITRKLHEAGLIHYPGLFKFYASLAVDEGEIHPGIWDLNTRYDYHALVNMMSPSSSREVIELMIPEGYSCRQIFNLMEENKICTALDLGAYAATGELDEFWFLQDVERGDMYCLEGFLFPDTYQFYKNDSPRNVLTKMLNNFEAKFDEAMIGQIDSLNLHLAELMKKGGHGEQYILDHQFDVRDVINVASLIEKETSSAEEGYVISSVIYNRLYNWGDNIPYLNIDATIVYALGGKTELTPEDLKVNSPYNTYTHTGLTPGPIANPGLASIRAALDPADSDYYFYVLDPALGSHRFSTTYEEHKANIASIGG